MKSYWDRYAEERIARRIAVKARPKRGQLRARAAVPRRFARVKR